MDHTELSFSFSKLWFLTAAFITPHLPSSASLLVAMPRSCGTSLSAQGWVFLGRKSALKVQHQWYMVESSIPVLTDFHSNWQIGMSMLEMLCESQGNKSQNVHMRICGTHSICHNVYHHFKTCTRPQFFTSGILELLQLGFAI